MKVQKIHSCQPGPSDLFQIHHLVFINVIQLNGTNILPQLLLLANVVDTVYLRRRRTVDPSAR